MIKGLFETHINVSSLERSMDFYQNTLGLTLGGVDEKRRIAFFWLGNWGEAMLGVWEKPKEYVLPQHYAFRCDVEDVLSKSVSYLKERNLKPYNFLKDGHEKPMVFAWMPAVSIYFKDPDNHELEFIAMLKGEPRPKMGILTYEEWINLENK
jgi:lactoylglutathione lyase